jgi:predicted GH43/DUF377 family glycosyl hydrolase
MHVPAVPAAKIFAVERFGVVMRPEADRPHEAWGVLNPGGVRTSDGTMHLFPRLIAEGNYSRIGHARVRYDGDVPVGVDRLGIALEPREPYEVSPSGGGVEDPRIVYLPLLKRYVMTYTAFIPYEPRVALAISEDLVTWKRLGLVRYEPSDDAPDLNRCSDKDATFIPEVISDPRGVPSLGLLHRPTTRIHIAHGNPGVAKPPSGEETHENIWISYVSVEAVLADIAALTSVRRHERVMAPEQPWEQVKVGAGSPPVRLAYGWALPYHAVSLAGGHLRYCMGLAILDLDRPSRVLYRTPSPIMEPEAPYELNGLVADVVFPTAATLDPEGLLNVFYGAADRVIAAARVTLPSRLPAGEQGKSV